MVTIEVLLVTPRTHTNLLYLIDDLDAQGIRLSLLVRHRSPDFGQSHGERILMVNSAEANLRDCRRFDLVIYRSFNEELVTSARLLKKENALEITYDQLPIGGSASRLALQAINRAKRRMLGRPAIRISPRFEGDPLQPISDLEWPFLHPGPSESETPHDLEDMKSPSLRVVMIAKRYNARKRLLLGVEALSRISRPIELQIILSTPEYTSRHTPGQWEKFIDRRLFAKLSSTDLDVVIQHNLPSSAVRKLLAWADIYLLPSVREPYSISNIEAAQAGTLTMMMRSNGSFSSMPLESVFGLRRLGVKRQVIDFLEALDISEPTRLKRRKCIKSAYAENSAKSPSLAKALRSILEVHGKRIDGT